MQRGPTSRARSRTADLRRRGRAVRLGDPRRRRTATSTPRPARPGSSSRSSRTAPSAVVLDSDENNLRRSSPTARTCSTSAPTPNGLLYRVNRKTGESFVLYNAPRRRSAALVMDAKGNIYAGTAEAREEGAAAATAGAAEKDGRPEGGAAGVPIPSEPPKDPSRRSCPTRSPVKPDPIPKAIPSTPKPPRCGAESDRDPRRACRAARVGAGDCCGIVMPAAGSDRSRARRSPPRPAAPRRRVPQARTRPDARSCPARKPRHRARRRPQRCRCRAASADRRTRPTAAAPARGERGLQDRPRRFRHRDLPPAGAGALDGRARGHAADRDRQRGADLPGQPGRRGNDRRREGRAQADHVACCRRPTAASTWALANVGGIATMSRGYAAKGHVHQPGARRDADQPVRQDAAARLAAGRHGLKSRPAAATCSDAGRKGLVELVERGAGAGVRADHVAAGAVPPVPADVHRRGAARRRRWSRT